MRIAIIDGVQQDIGLKILFPQADYFIDNIGASNVGGGDKSESLKKYNIEVKRDLSLINDKNYDYLFIIISLYDAYKIRKFFKQQVYNILQKELEIINNNTFKKVCIFDNYDYDYDPSDIINNDKIDIFFKRNYNKNKNYQQNVVPFPFIMFGAKSLIEKLDDKNESNIKYKRLFFSGTIFTHIDNEINYVRNRRVIYSKISNIIYNPGRLNYSNFLKCIRESKYSLDLNGVGDPNKRTFEILSQGSLRMGEYNNLKWPFREEFSEETIFKTAEELIEKIKYLENNPEIYNKCLKNQKNIYNKYFNKKWIKKYITSYIK
tara:strand:+ start:1435 stop:2391 length:957 start_codon:yes stop_codon:yes gene_type:complete